VSGGDVVVVENGQQSLNGFGRVTRAWLEIFSQNSPGILDSAQ
jgi:hypothetical protein